MSAQQNLVPNGVLRITKVVHLFHPVIYIKVPYLIVCIIGIYQLVVAQQIILILVALHWSFAVLLQLLVFNIQKTGNLLDLHLMQTMHLIIHWLMLKNMHAVNNKLKANTKYCLQLYASLSDSSNYKTNVIQVYFTVNDTSIYSEK